MQATNRLHEQSWGHACMLEHDCTRLIEGLVLADDSAGELHIHIAVAKLIN